MSQKAKRSKRRPTETKATWNESLLAYKISLKSEEVSKLRFKVQQEAAINGTQREKLKRLEEERRESMAAMKQKSEEFREKVDGQDVGRTQVIELMKEKWKFVEEQSQLIRELQGSLEEVEAEIAGQDGQARQWIEYRQTGRSDQSLQIKLMEQEIIDMETQFGVMSGHLERAQSEILVNLRQKASKSLDGQKYTATEKALSRLDNQSQQEIMDNEWLKKEVEIHRRDAITLAEKVQMKEKDNLAQIAAFSESSSDDNDRRSRCFFMTQFLEPQLDAEVLMRDSDDLLISNEDELHRVKQDRLDRQRIRQIPVDGAAAVTSLHESNRDGAAAVTSLHESNRWQDHLQEESRRELLDNYLHFEDDPPEAAPNDVLQLGPLESRRLRLDGRRMQLLTPPELPPDGELAGLKEESDDWPVTQRMLKMAIAH